VWRIRGEGAHPGAAMSAEPYDEEPYDKALSAVTDADSGDGCWWDTATGVWWFVSVDTQGIAWTWCEP
jgi:hypothetical protein